MHPMILGRAGTANNVRACAHMCVPSFFHAHPSVAHVRARIYPSPSRVCTSTDCLSRTTLPIDAALPHPPGPLIKPPRGLIESTPRAAFISRRGNPSQSVLVPRTAARRKSRFVTGASVEIFSISRAYPSPPPSRPNAA